jgi:hypothetical protein
MKFFIEVLILVYGRLVDADIRRGPGEMLEVLIVLCVAVFPCTI